MYFAQMIRTMYLKRILFTLALLGVCSLSFAEKYNVLHVKGDIRLAKTKILLKPGDVIDSEDKVIFSSGECVAALFSPSKGRFTLSPNKKNIIPGEEFIAYVKSNLFPAKKGLSTRAAGTLKNELELQQHFGRDRYVVLGLNKTRVSPEVYPMQQNAFFYLRFTHNGESVNKQLLYQEDQLILNAENILKVDGEPVPASEVSDYELFYYDANTTVSQKICTLNPVFPEEEAFAGSIQLMVNVLAHENLSKEEIRSEIDGFVAEYFGYADPDMLNEWLEINIEF